MDQKKSEIPLSGTTTSKFITKVSAIICGDCDQVIHSNTVHICPRPNKKEAIVLARWEDARRNELKKLPPILVPDKEPDKETAQHEIAELEDAYDIVKGIDAVFVHSKAENFDRHTVLFLLGKIHGAAQKKAKEIMEEYDDA